MNGHHIFIADRASNEMIANPTHGQLDGENIFSPDPDRA